MSESDWPFDPLRPGDYQMIMADPPWSFRLRSKKGVSVKGAAGQYRTMDLDAIKALPVGDLAARDCVLFLWATHAMIGEALDVLSAWGFSFSTSGVWVKKTAGGALAFGTGYRLRNASDPFLIGVRGRPQTAKNIRTVIEGRAREHSRKPDEAYRAAESMLKGAARADLFARQRRPGWEAWGDEAEKFSATRLAAPSTEAPTCEN